jgi:fatty acid desaturase
MQIFHVSPLAVLYSGIAQWLLGALWYGYVFRARWKALVGIPEGEKPKHAWFPMLASFIANLVLSFVLAHLIKWSGATALPRGVYIGAICWVGFMAPPLLTEHIFEKRPARLFAINAAYWLLAMMIGGGILADLNVG